MMNIQVEGIPKKDRAEFKCRAYAISDKVNTVAFADDNAVIAVLDPSFCSIDENWLSEKCKIKKAIYKMIEEFRTYQFNRG